jgi:hypothetical protein
MKLRKFFTIRMFRWIILMNWILFIVAQSLKYLIATNITSIGMYVILHVIVSSLFYAVLGTYVGVILYNILNDDF